MQKSEMLPWRKTKSQHLFLQQTRFHTLYIICPSGRQAHTVSLLWCATITISCSKYTVVILIHKPTNSIHKGQNSLQKKKKPLRENVRKQFMLFMCCQILQYKITNKKQDASCLQGTTVATMWSQCLRSEQEINKTCQLHNHLPRASYTKHTKMYKK